MLALLLDRLLKRRIVCTQFQGRYYLGSEKPGIHGPNILIEAEAFASPLYTSGSSVPQQYQNQRIRSPGRCYWGGRAVSQTSETSGYIGWLSGASTTLLAESTR